MTAEIYEFDIRNILVILPTLVKQKKIAQTYLENTKNFFELTDEVASVKNSLNNIEQDIL
jgi:hypothetical protein